MIKKKYLVAFLTLFCVVVVSSFITYNINYSLYIEESKDNIKDLSDSVSHQYDSIFFQICNTVERTMNKLKNQALSDNEIVELLDTYSADSYYIRDMAVIYKEETTILSSNMGINKQFDLNKVMPFFFIEDKEMCLGLTKSSSEEDNVFYAVNKLHLPNQESVLLLVGLDYDLINKIVRPDSYKVFGGYLYLLSNDGYFLYHKDKSLMGKNLYIDEDFIRNRTSMDIIEYNKLLKVIKNEKRTNEQQLLSYNEYNTDKLCYYNYLTAFQGVTFLAIDFNELKNNQIVAIIRTIIPLFISLLIASYILFRYIFLIKYTDYFTEVKNELAFRGRIKKLAKKGYTSENYLIVKIENVSSGEDKDFLYDDRIYYYISNYFKKIGYLYNELYRISRVHYIFVLQDSSDIKDIKELVNLLNDNINTKSNDSLYIRGKMLLFTIEDLSKLNNYEVDSKVLHHMENNCYDLADTDAISFIKYGSILDKINQRLKEKLFLESAILNNQFVAYYQPIVNLDTEKIHKYEVLMRINDSDQHFSTAQLIKVAEEENMVEKIDRSIIQQSFYQYNKYQHQNKKWIRLSINLSGKSINEKMVEYIIHMTEKCNVNPAHITFELTETAALNNLEASIKNLNILRNKGFKLAIDDFGTGYSHVELLSKLDVDYIKIDGMFIQGVEKDAQKLKTLNALVYISKNYNTKIIAEYIENEKVILVLKKLGIEYGQGYYFGRPDKDFK